MHNFYGEEGQLWLFVCGEKGEPRVYFVKSSKLDTQHEFHKILLTRYWNTIKQVRDPTWSAQNVKKIYFRFAVNFAKLSKLET